MNEIDMKDTVIVQENEEEQIEEIPVRDVNIKKPDKKVSFVPFHRGKVYRRLPTDVKSVAKRKEESIQRILKVISAIFTVQPKKDVIFTIVNSFKVSTREARLFYDTYKKSLKKGA